MPFNHSFFVSSYPITVAWFLSFASDRPVFYVSDSDFHILLIAKTNIKLLFIKVKVGYQNPSVRQKLFSNPNKDFVAHRVQWGVPMDSPFRNKFIMIPQRDVGGDFWWHFLDNFCDCMGVLAPQALFLTNIDGSLNLAISQFVRN